MAYLGRKGQTAALASADLPTNSITTSHIVANAVTSAKIGVDVIVAEDIANNAITVAEIADDAVTGAKLANNIAISTTGAIAGTGGLTMDGATVFNEASADVDFRVESNGNANMLVVDASTDRVGIGTAAPRMLLDVSASSANGEMLVGNTAALDQNAHIGMSKRLNYGNVIISKNLRGTPSSDAYRTIGTAASGYAAMELKYGGVISFTTSSASTTADETVTPTDRMTINSSGNVGIGYTPLGDGVLTVYQTVDSYIAYMANAQESGNPNLLYLKFDGMSPNDTTSWFVRGDDSGGEEFKICSDGSYDSASDRRIKENIVDVESMLDKVNSLRVVNYNRIGDESKGLHIGAIAQEVEEVFPHLISVSPAVDAVEEVRDEEGNITTKEESAKEERYMMYKLGLIFPLIKAVQELSAKVTALESA